MFSGGMERGTLYWNDLNQLRLLKLKKQKWRLKQHTFKIFSDLINIAEDLHNNIHVAIVCIVF